MGSNFNKFIFVERKLDIYASFILDTEIVLRLSDHEMFNKYSEAQYH